MVLWQAEFLTLRRQRLARTEVAMPEHLENKPRHALTAGLLAGLFCIGVAPALPQQIPPDFSANNAGWVSVGGEWTPLPGSPSPVTQDPAHRYVPNNVGGQPTFRIADINNPNLTQFAKDLLKKANEEVLAGKPMWSRSSRCWATGVPAFLLTPAQPMFFVQTPKQVTMIAQHDDDVRRVYLDVPHSANPRPTWYGESVGHYEGDTLVIDTIGLNDKTFVNNFRTPHTDKLHVVERFKLVDGGKAMQVDVTFEDSDAFNAPWSVIQRYDRIERPMEEQICAENNQHLFDYHMPVANSPDF